ncbi:hypothetical protein CQW23_30987 [Capsicum baccatum]|uniref:Ubiquitin-like protease family profile domain-containing protein n=1 Tax=Capsicum baccatum TaxID=33114 RepID=A0A2G2V8Z9_CAPBA|nr:hypothetical protein CQW23_30987 [Capsicum baccatum]
MVAKNEDAIANIIQGFCMPAGLPWHMVNEVYVPINCGKEFHWVLAVIALKERLIHVYDSLSDKRKKEPLIEIQKLAVMLLTYLSDNGFMIKPSELTGHHLKLTKERLLSKLVLVKKANEGYTSDNGDPPLPRKSVIEEIEANATVTLE